MDFEKKQITKEDGRYLVYYHFGDTATTEQTEAFQLVEIAESDTGSGAANSSDGDGDKITNAASPGLPQGARRIEGNPIV